MRHLILPLAALVLAAGCVESDRDREPEPPIQPNPQPLEGDPIEEILVGAPTAGAQFAAAHAELPASEQLAHLRVRVYYEASSQSLWYRIAGVTPDGRDHVRVVQPDGSTVEQALPSWTVTPALADALGAMEDELSGMGEQDLGELGGVADRAAAAITGSEDGGYGLYRDAVLADVNAYLGTTDWEDDPEDDPDPLPPPGGGGGSGSGGGGPPAQMRTAGVDPSVLPEPQVAAAGVAELVCSIKFAATVMAHVAALTATARAVVVQTQRMVRVCARPPYLPCAIEMARLAALGVIGGGLANLLRMHVDFHSNVNDWVSDIENANVGKKVNAEEADANVANARGAARKGLTIASAAFATIWTPVGLALGIAHYKSVTRTTMIAMGLSAAFIGCSWYVVTPFWQNAGVKLDAKEGAPPAGAGGGGGGGGGGGPPPPPGHHFFGGPGFPGFPLDSQRNRSISPMLTSVPPALAAEQLRDIDLQATVSPFTGQPMNNQQSVFSLQHQGEQWGLQLCSKLVPTVDTGGPYYWPNGELMQQANTPYWNISGAWPHDGTWSDGIALGSTTINTGYPTLTQQRVCDGDDNNDGLPDAGQPDGSDNDQDGLTDEPGEVNRFCFDRDGDGLEDLFSVTLDSDMPNRAPDRTLNCGTLTLDAIPKPQLDTLPGVDPLAVLAMQNGREISQTTIVHLTAPYREKSTGAKIGTSGQLRFKARARLHLPSDPCIKYDRIYDPYGSVRYGYVWNSARPGCSSSPGGGGGGPMGPMF